MKLQDVIGINKHTGLNLGRNEIWYKKNSSWGQAFTDEGLIVDPNDLDKTHSFIGQIQESDLDNIYNLMQMEVWSPNREGHYVLRSAGVDYFSMCEFDVIVVNDIARRVSLVMKNGFRWLNSPVVVHASKNKLSKKLDKIPKNIILNETELT